MAYLFITLVNLLLTFSTQRALKWLAPEFEDEDSAMLRGIRIFDIIFDMGIVWLIWVFFQWYLQDSTGGYWDFMSAYTGENMGLFGFVIASRVLFEGWFGGGPKEEDGDNLF
ncbi:MAG: hypothetical protein QME81_15765 [bacterium]|nr:hypothetical protein [bacterium]